MRSWKENFDDLVKRLGFDETANEIWKLGMIAKKFLTQKNALILSEEEITTIRLLAIDSVTTQFLEENDENFGIMIKKVDAQKHKELFQKLVAFIKSVENNSSTKSSCETRMEFE